MTKIFCKRISVLLFVVYSACIIPVTSRAQVLSLNDAVSAAVNNYPLLQQRKSEAAAAKAHITTVSGNRLPSLVLQDQVTLGTDNSLQGAYFSLGMVPSTPGSYTNVHGNPNTGNIAISFLKWDFYTFGYYNAQQREARSQAGVSNAILNKDRYVVTENTIALYLDWLKKYRLLQIQDENLQRAKIILGAIRATVLSGLKPGVDSSMASATYADARISYLQALDNYKNQRIAIAMYTGWGADDDIPDTSILYPPVSNALLQHVTDSVDAGHPMLEFFRKRYELQLAENNAVSRKYLPKFGLEGAAWVRNSGISPTGAYPEQLTDGMPYSKDNYLVGLTLTYNLFDLKHRHDDVAEGRLKADAKAYELQTEQLSLNEMMQQANATYKTTVEELNELPVQVAALKQVYGQQLALYRAGLNTLLEVTNAQYALLQAETNYVITQDALLQLMFIRAGLAGQLDNYLQNFKR